MKKRSKKQQKRGGSAVKNWNDLAELTVKVPESPNAPDVTDDVVADIGSPDEGTSGEAEPDHPVTLSQLDVDVSGGGEEEQEPVDEAKSVEPPPLFDVADVDLKRALDEFEAERAKNGKRDKPWSVMTYQGVLRVVRYTYIKKARKLDAKVMPSLFTYQARYSLNGIASTQNLGRSDQISFVEAYKKALEFRDGVGKKRTELQQNRPLLQSQKTRRSQRIGDTFKTTDDALAFLRYQRHAKTSYLSVYWQLLILLPTIGASIDFLIWDDFDLVRNRLKIRRLKFGAMTAVFEIEIDDRIGKLISSWKTFDYYSSSDFVFDSHRERVRSPERVKILQEELNHVWQQYPLNSKEVGMFWKRELRSLDNLSNSFLDRAFNSLFLGMSPTDEDLELVNYLHRNWWSRIDEALIYSKTWNTVKPNVNSRDESSSASLVMPRKSGELFQSIPDHGFSLREFVADPRHSEYSRRSIRAMQSADQSGTAGKSDPLLHNSDWIWESIQKIPVYSWALPHLRTVGERVALMLASDVGSPNFVFENQPAFFLVDPGFIENPDDLMDSGFEIEYCETKTKTTTGTDLPSSFLKKAQLRLIPFISKRLVEATITSHMYLYRIDITGSVPITNTKFSDGNIGFPKTWTP